MNKLFSTLRAGIGCCTLAIACQPQLAEQGHPCPCSSQWTCCASANVCVPEGTTCPAGETGGLNEDSGASASDDADRPPVDSGVIQPPVDSGVIQPPVDSAIIEPPVDSGVIATEGGDASPQPAACSNPGPFTIQPTEASLPTLIVGTWIACGNSLFTGAGLPNDDVGIVIRADQTWQRLGFANGQLTSLNGHYDYGSWSAYGGGCCGEMLLLSWDTSSLAVSSKFTVDGQSMYADTAAGGNEATLVKVANGASPDAASDAAQDVISDH